LHDLTTRLIRKYDLICIEDLNVKALSRGRNARSIQDASFGEIRRQPFYKAEWHDRMIIEVDRWYASSKTCSNCKHRLDELRLDVRYWTCPKCKAFHDRDLRVEARVSSPEEILWEVLAHEARSGQFIN
jgi:putative transposase